MHSKLSRARLRALALAVPAAALAVAVTASPLAGADTASSSASTAVIDMVVEKGKLKFTGPATVAKGDQLEIVNSTNPRQVGPHTFSLVTKGSLPKTPKARQTCFAPKHICLAIAEWHKLNPKTERIGLNPVKVGPAGWSTLGSTTKKGDSWFTEKKGETFTQEVSASAPPTIYYICAVHPFMQGKVDVTPAVAPAPTS